MLLLPLLQLLPLLLLLLLLLLVTLELYCSTWYIHAHWGQNWHPQGQGGTAVFLFGGRARRQPRTAVRLLFPFVYSYNPGRCSGRCQVPYLVRLVAETLPQSTVAVFMAEAMQDLLKTCMSGNSFICMASVYADAMVVPGASTSAGVLRAFVRG